MKKINITNVIDTYIRDIRDELNQRWNLWDKDLTKSHIYEVIGGIISRQTSLAIQFAKNPHIWNGEIAPMILRSMADNHINLAWVMSKSDEKCKEFILHGLGQLKLELEHRKKKMEEQGINTKDHPYIQNEEDFINSQRYTFLTEINFGSWSGSNTRQMAEEAGLIDFYNNVYQPFSNCTHSTWGHISKYNTNISDNPLHKFLRHPDILEFNPDIHFMELSAKYLEKSISLFDENFPLNIKKSTAYLNLKESFKQIINNNNEA